MTLLAPGKSYLLRGALCLIVLKHDTTCMGLLYLLRSKRTAGMGSTKKFPADVGDDVMCFKTDNDTEFVKNIFTTLCCDQTIPTSTQGTTGRSPTAWPSAGSV